MTKAVMKADKVRRKTVEAVLDKARAKLEVRISSNRPLRRQRLYQTDIHHAPRKVSPPDEPASFSGLNCVGHPSRPRPYAPAQWNICTASMLCFQRLCDWRRFKMRRIMTTAFAIGVAVAGSAFAQTVPTPPGPSGSAESPAATSTTSEPSQTAAAPAGASSTPKVQPQGPTGPLETGAGGAPASSVQGDTPPAMQVAPEGSPGQSGDRSKSAQ